MIRRPPRSTHCISSAASDVYKRQKYNTLKVRNGHVVKIYRKLLKIFFSKTTRPISTKIDTEHSWLKGIKFRSNDGICLFSKRRYSNNVRYTYMYNCLYLKNRWANFNLIWHKAFKRRQ